MITLNVNILPHRGIQRNKLYTYYRRIHFYDFEKEIHIYITILFNGNSSFHKNLKQNREFNKLLFNLTLRKFIATKAVI